MYAEAFIGTLLKRCHCGFLEHVSITLIDNTDPSDSVKREDYWRHTLCTMAPYGLNIEDHV